MTAEGATQPTVGALLCIESKWLHRHYRDALDVGIGQANAAVALNLFRIATGEGSGAVTAAILRLKTRAGWREADRGVEVATDQPTATRWANEHEAA